MKKGYDGGVVAFYVSYRKPRKISDEHREQARQKMLEINSDGK